MSDAVISQESLPIVGEGQRSLGWWGVMALVATEGALFAYLLFTYFYAAVNVEAPWPPSGPPDLKIATLNTVILISTSGTLWLAERYIGRNQLDWAAGLIAVTLLLGVVFVSLQLVEWGNKDFTPLSHTYGSIFFLITGIHLAHVCVGLIALGFLLLWTCLGYFDAERRNVLSVGAIYWHFVDVVWLFIFSSLYLSPHLGLVHGG